MPARNNHDDFGGRHWETGTLHNALALRGATAPHTGCPYSEALLLGVSGGAALGYFIFEYKGHLPHLALLTRNTFNPLETICERLALPREVQQTTNPQAAQEKLLAALDAGHAPIVWADWLTLPYNALGPNAANWGMVPLLVVGRDGDDFLVADRSRRALRLSARDLQAARGRVKQDRFRMVTVDPPDPKRLPGAVQKGIWNCISLFTEDPPKGAKHNFGFAAYQRWAAMLANERNKQAWARVFPPGAAMFNALAGSPDQPGAYQWIMTWGAGPGAERGVYADFLDEAEAILERPALNEAAGLFRESQAAWTALAGALLPDSVPLFKEARALLDRRRDLFVERGGAAVEEVRGINLRLRELLAAAGRDFPLTAAEAADLRLLLRDHVLRVHDVEVKAVEVMQAALA